MDSVAGDILRPKVLILPRHEPLPNVTGASIIGMIAISGADVFVVNNSSGNWARLSGV